MKKHQIFILFLYLILIQSFSSALGQSLPRACGGTVERYHAVGFHGSQFFWTVEGGTIQSQTVKQDAGINKDTSIVEILWTTSEGFYSISVLEQVTYTYATCFGTIQMDTVEIVTPSITIAEKDAIICEEGAFTFNVTPGHDSYVWDNNSPTTSASYMTSMGGWHRVRSTLIIDARTVDTTRCMQNDSTFITIAQYPVVDLGEDTTLCADDVLELIAGVPDSLNAYEWSTGDISESISVDPGKKDIMVKVTSQKGCITYDTIAILPCTRSYLLGDIPNTFTPGELDGLNDTWYVPNLEGKYPEARIEIFDRWGRMVWNSDKSTNKRWDGNDMQGRELPMDAYYYIIYINRDGTNPEVGHINLVR